MCAGLIAEPEIIKYLKIDIKALETMNCRKFLFGPGEDGYDRR
jgi:hypothetical protein